MKYFACLLLLSVAPLNSAEPQHKHGVHGMLLFGDTEQLYISHLPLFAHPHDQQVIAAVKINGIAAAALPELLATEKLITLVPEPFDLKHITQASFQFKARLYRGHFERGGQPHGEEVTIQITELIINQALSGFSTKTAHHYQLTNHSSEYQYYFRVIDSRPAADHIIQVKSDKPLPPQLHFETEALYSEAASIAAQLGITAAEVSSLYLEINELQ